MFLACEAPFVVGFPVEIHHSGCWTVQHKIFDLKTWKLEAHTLHLVWEFDAYWSSDSTYFGTGIDDKMANLREENIYKRTWTECFQYFNLVWFL